MTISVREPGRPQTVPKNSPSTNVLPSTSRPSATKKAVTTSRSATVTPTWSKRRTCDTGPSSRRRISRASATAGVPVPLVAGPRKRTPSAAPHGGHRCHERVKVWPGDLRAVAGLGLTLLRDLPHRSGVASPSGRVLLERRMASIQLSISPLYDHHKGEKAWSSWRAGFTVWGIVLMTISLTILVSAAINDLWVVPAMIVLLAGGTVPGILILREKWRDRQQARAVRQQSSGIGASGSTTQYGSVTS